MVRAWRRKPKADTLNRQHQKNNKKKEERREATWDIRYAFSNYLTLVASQILIALFSFGSVILCTRYLGADGYGVIVAVIAASSVAQIFVNWTCAGLTRLGVEEFVTVGEISKSFWARTIILIPNLLVMCAFSLAWLPLVASWLKLPAKAYVLVVAHFVVNSIWLHFQQSFQAAKLPRLQGVLLALERVVIFSLLGTLFLVGQFNWFTAVCSYILTPLLMSIIGFFKIRNLVSWRILYDSEILVRLLRFSFPLIPFSLIGYFSTSFLDAIFISQYLDKTELGIYSVAYQINGILMQFPLLAGSLLLPLFVTLQSKRTGDNVKKFISEVLPLLTLVWGFLCIFVAILGTFLIPLLFGSQVAEASKILWILAIGAAISFPSFVGYIPYVHQISATYIGIPMAIAGSVTNVVANFLLIPKYGLIGCAWATVLSVATSLLVVFVILNIRHSLKHRWTIQALMPAIVTCSYYSWSNNILVSLLIGSGIILLLFITYRKYWFEGLNFIRDYRNFVRT